MKKLLFIAPILLTGCLEFFAPNVEDAEVSLLAPADSLITNQNTLIFRWESEASIESYRFQLAQPDFQSPTFLVDTLLTDSRLDLFVPEGEFQWQVRAEHPGSESAYSARKGWVDQTPPLVPVLLSPIDGDTVSGAIILHWEHADNLDWAAVTDSLWVYQEVDSFLKLRVRRVVSEPKTLVEGLPLGSYAWFVKSVDPAGNVSGENVNLFVVH